VRALRPGLALLAAVETVLGLWTLLFPASFYADVPTVGLTPPFSEHPFRDFGGATLGLAVVLTAAAIWTERRLVAVALLAYLAFSAPHLAFHLEHLHGADVPAATALVVVLAGSVALPLALLAVALHRRPLPATSFTKDARQSTREHHGPGIRCAAWSPPCPTCGRALPCRRMDPSRHPHFAVLTRV
jgi:hypothetical protein